jgi:quercetin dioxygenase-like cupin family protein
MNDRRLDLLGAALFQSGLEIPDEPALQPSGRLRLLEKLTGPERFSGFISRVAELFDVDTSQAQGALTSLHDDEGWISLAPGTLYRDFEGGPATAGASPGIVRIAPGGGFPGHNHLAHERTLVLRGRLRSDGVEYRAGDTIVMEPGTWHDLEVVGDQELVYAVVVGAIQIAPKPAPEPD